MRPPILAITVAFGLGLWAGLDASAVRSAPYAGLPVLLGVALLWRRAPVGAACGVMLVAGALWGAAAVRERAATCGGRWSREPAAERSRAAIVRLRDPAPAAGGVVEGDVRSGSCGGTLRIRWPEG
ncbi:MAG: hypothetical protein ACREMC_09585, partial [Gemmatimonadales bacterium]